MVLGWLETQLVEHGRHATGHCDGCVSGILDLESAHERTVHFMVVPSKMSTGNEENSGNIDYLDEGAFEVTYGISCLASGVGGLARSNARDLFNVLADRLGECGWEVLIDREGQIGDGPGWWAFEGRAIARPSITASPLFYMDDGARCPEPEPPTPAPQG